MLPVLVSCATYLPANSAARPRPTPTLIYRYGDGLALPSPVSAQVAQPSAGPRLSADLLAVVNADRRQAGLPPLAGNACLTAVAKQNAQRMAANQAGSSWNGSDRDAACGLNDPQTGEVAAYWTGGIDAASLNGLFMKNPNDRQTIFFRWYCCAGYAWAVGANGYGYASVEFG